jgi:hypothetical protein
VDGREVERAQDVQRGCGDVYSTELECVAYRIDECDGIVRKDDYVIQIMRARSIDLGERKDYCAERDSRGGGGGHIVLTGVIHRSFNPTKVIQLSGRPGKSRVMTMRIWSSIRCIFAMQNLLSVIGIGLGASGWGLPS